MRHTFYALYMLLTLIFITPAYGQDNVPPELTSQIAEIMEKQQSTDWMTKVNPNIRYVFETTQNMLPTMDQTRVAADDIAHVVFQQVVLMGVAGLIWHGVWILVPIGLGAFFRRQFNTWADTLAEEANLILKSDNSFNTREQARAFNDNASGWYAAGVVSLLIGFFIASISGFNMFEPLTQTLAPGAWLVTEMVR